MHIFVSMLNYSVVCQYPSYLVLIVYKTLSDSRLIERIVNRVVSRSKRATIAQNDFSHRRKYIKNQIDQLLLLQHFTTKKILDVLYIMLFCCVEVK